MHSIRYTALTAVGVCMLAATAPADIIINLTQSGTGVLASISGSGTVDTDGGGNPGAALNFINFTGSPFNASSTPALAVPWTISGLDASDGNAAYSSSISGLTFDDAGDGGSDLDLSGSFSIGDGDTYTAAGSSLVTGLLFTALNPGVYTSTEGDSADFGSVTLNITAVPEPQSFALLCGIAVFGWTAKRRRRCGG